MLRHTPVLLTAVALAAAPASAQLADYSQDFEALDRTNPDALANDGFKIFGAGINPDGSTSYTFGVFGAPNNITSPDISVISDSASGGNPPAGDQGLVYFSAYGNGSHNDPNDNRDLRLSLFQEQIIGAADIGNTVSFSWLAQGNSSPPTGDAFTEAFLITLDPNNGFAATNDLAVDTTNTPAAAPVSGMLTLDLTDAALQGQILQFGFRNTSSDFEGSAVDYDNIVFVADVAAIPEPASAVLLAAASGLLLRRRR
ncbi:PEP-CTERM sorting domain-containing protein [Phycisphaera mikurensis]|uniref:PEP-CTERM protein-sorting domain-containing protein n=1 Tax=Phycisphaera mikurensis (strain NBRC 102666 / KCTC 22515 / FYK2301M01) TaxID=1142394 RepID=I0ICZ9_PHYMF|nr:PEP-CTERM sorting domain-containing protein [Phycisphaera mikurensis]MBB6442267.1 hypothetical protein [Phycisphaera mikurensis]BAM03137.1 hypothetical protein PSMK_09780 [Phycisphaera mikurensis NBRC 102666]